MRFSLLLVLSALALASCGNRSSRRYIEPKEQEHITIERFDQDFFAVNTDSLATALPVLEKKYGSFVSLYTEEMVGLGSPYQMQFGAMMNKFVHDFAVNKAYETCQKVYPNLDELQSELSAAFSRYHTVFPKKVIPHVLTYISGFNQSITLTDSVLAIGLDKYLGRDNKVYKELDFPRYLVYNFTPERLPVDAMRGWIMGDFPYRDSVNNLVSRMVYEGKILYLTAQMLPNIPDSTLFGYSPEQMKWCSNNEKWMWTTLIERKLLFSTDQFMAAKFVNEAPFTVDFSHEAPGRAAVWIGYNIVDSYMQHNKNVSLAQLMATTDEQRIFQNAKYRPQ